MTDKEFDAILQRKLQSISPLDASPEFMGNMIQNLAASRYGRRSDFLRYSMFAACFCLGGLCFWAVDSFIRSKGNVQPRPAYSVESTSQSKEVRKDQERISVGRKDIAVTNTEIKSPGKHMENKRINDFNFISQRSRYSESKENVTTNAVSQIPKDQDVWETHVPFLPTLPWKEASAPPEIATERVKSVDKKLETGYFSQDVQKLPATQFYEVKSADERWPNPVVTEPVPFMSTLSYQAGLTLGLGHREGGPGLIVGATWKNRISLLTGINMMRGFNEHFRSGEDFSANHEDADVILDDPSLPAPTVIGSLHHQTIQWVIPVYLQYRIPLVKGFSALICSGAEAGLNENHQIVYRVVGDDEDFHYKTSVASRNINWVAGAGLSWKKRNLDFQILPMFKGGLTLNKEDRHHPFSKEMQVRSLYQF